MSLVDIHINAELALCSAAISPNPSPDWSSTLGRLLLYLHTSFKLCGPDCHKDIIRATADVLRSLWNIQSAKLGRLQQESDLGWRNILVLCITKLTLCKFKENWFICLVIFIYFYLVSFYFLLYLESVMVCSETINATLSLRIHPPFK